MYKLNFKKRVWIAKQYQNDVSAEKLALAQGIHRSAVYQIIKCYKEYGWDGLNVWDDYVSIISFSTSVFTGGFQQRNNLVENENRKSDPSPQASIPPVY